MPESVDASEAMVENWTKQLHERAARYQAMAERMQGQSVTERSKDGAIQVTVDSRGLLKDLVIEEKASGKRMAEVSAQVMQAVQRAQARIPELLQQALAETTGTEDAAAARLIEDAGKTFPAPSPEDEPAQPERDRRFLPEDAQDEPAPPRRPQAAPKQRRDDRDDEGFGGSVLS